MKRTSTKIAVSSATVLTILSVLFSWYAHDQGQDKDIEIIRTAVEKQEARVTDTRKCLENSIDRLDEKVERVSISLEGVRSDTRNILNTIEGLRSTMQLLLKEAVNDRATVESDEEDAAMKTALIQKQGAAHGR